ncbi:DNA-methyltransferase [Gracilibacillus kekensis]|uniref:Site-specific DNA-methyltransferase (Adenine-specific) n=1 Tax=Gracilibacillus kekensis TaxID=1027249 RepID=A0A1M7QR08_9BACI|nr:DNA methyltransferase [Gracilibacillus kekensis]SHN33680.1 site-specific DNA-methyltransferase (adenine-specific) [Gracilibacillus kekensis]
MKHLAEQTEDFILENLTLKNKKDLNENIKGIQQNGAIVYNLSLVNQSPEIIYSNLKGSINELPKKSVVCFIGYNSELAHLAYFLSEGLGLHYQYWITVRREITKEDKILPSETMSILVMSKSKKIKITRVLLPYTYCPACGKTTKDYGGKKHTFHHFGTTMSDVWKDVFFNPSELLASDKNKIITERIALMLSTEERRVYAMDFDNGFLWDDKIENDVLLPRIEDKEKHQKFDNQINTNNSHIIHGDSIKTLKSLPDNSVDYIFVDPPYNLEKKYGSYSDDMDIQNYFKWCDEWIYESIRVLKEGSYFSILNIPQWSVRHFAYLVQIADFESWITWDALSKPAGKIMPANYTILTFKKRGSSHKKSNEVNYLPEYMKQLADSYCLRASCVKSRGDNFHKPLTDLWTDIHRLKHNSLRYDHPCQLHPKLMKRIFEVYSNPGDLILDFFNGVGTSTLTAELIGRRYIGVDLDKKYVSIARERHKMIHLGQDPFGKNKLKAEEKTKNNTVKRVTIRKKEHRHISKKEVQMKIKALAEELDTNPSIEDALWKFPEIPRDFYELYFSSWAEVLAAVKVKGVNENKFIEDNYKGNISKKREIQQTWNL